MLAASVVETDNFSFDRRAWEWAPKEGLVGTLEAVGEIKVRFLYVRCVLRKRRMSFSDSHCSLKTSKS